MIKWFKKIFRKFINAFRGLIIMVKEEKSLWAHLFTTVCVIIAGMLTGLSILEWAVVIFAIALVISFEIVNTAIEYLVDIVSFEYNVKAKKIKDVAAMATLVVTIAAIIVGGIVFIPHWIKI